MPIVSMTNMYVKVAVVIVALAVIGACKFYLKMPEGNAVETVAEEVIKEESGLDISSIVAKA